MELISHALWTYILLRIISPEYILTHPTFLILVLIFSMIPDIIETAPLLICIIAKRKKYKITGIKSLIEYAIKVTQKRTEIYKKEFPWATKLSFYTHSHIIFLLILGILSLISQTIFLAFLIGIGFHLLIDIFTHKGFYATRPFYPLNNFKIQGFFNWYENKTFAKLNYFLLLLIYILVFFLSNTKS